MPAAQNFWNVAPARHALPFEHAAPVDKRGVKQEKPGGHSLSPTDALPVPTHLPAGQGPEHVGTLLAALPYVPAGHATCVPEPGWQ